MAEWIPAMQHKEREEERKKEELLAVCNAEIDTLAVSLKAFKQGFINKKDLKVLTAINPKVSVVERRRALLIRGCARLEGKLLDFTKYGSELEIETSAIQALRRGLIDEDVFDHLQSLRHSEIPYSMRCRYLLQFVHDFLNRKLETFKELALNLGLYRLSELNPLKFAKDAERDDLIEKSVLDYLVSQCPKAPIENFRLLECSAARKMFHIIKDLEKDLSLKDPSTIVSRAANSLIAPEQLSILYELLVKYAFKWEKIGIALNFQPPDLRNIQASPMLMTDAPESYLRRLLEDWLNKKLKHTLPPSMYNLLKALNSQAVGLGSLADEFEKKVFVSTPQAALNRSYCSMLVDSSNTRHDVVYVDEGASTLLEIQTPAHTGNKIYKWLKDGVKLSQDCTRPILCLHNADIEWDGCEFSCEIKCKGEIGTPDKLTTNIAAPIITVNVSCKLDHFRSTLASMYQVKPEVPEDTWPPVGNLKYINLALVKQQEVNYNSEYARLTIRGDLDDILKEKQIITYDDKEFYRNLSSGKLILIEGRPGCGKTTFVHKLAQDWAIKSGGAIRLLLLVSLRVLNTFSNPDLSDILKLFEDLQVSKDIIEQRSGKGVCFIFDGFDEFSPQDQQSSVVNRIINKTYLHRSIVIVASRPAAISRLRPKASMIVEVVGFLNEQILEYFDHYPFSTSSKSAELISYLGLHPNIFHMCYLPIHATMVAFLFQEMGKVPKTETEIYTHFTRFTLIRSFTKTKEFEPVGIDLHSLTREEKYCFSRVCLLAFKMTLSSIQVLDQNKVSSQTIDSSLGLITVDRTAGLYGYKNVYTFMHLTFQEYLAAYHITTLSDEEQMKLIQEYGGRNHMLVVWKFYCGLIKIKPFDSKFKSILCKSKGNTLYHIQCGYETQQKIACAQLLKGVDYHFKLEDKYLGTPDFTAIGYVTNTTLIPTKLSLLNCNINVEAVDALLSEMDDRARDSIHALHIVTATVDGSQMKCIKKLLANLRSLNSLSLEAEVAKITKSFSVCSDKQFKLLDLASLSVINIDIQPLLSNLSFAKLSMLRFKGEFQVLITYLLYCKHIKELDISCNDLNDEDAKILARSLKDYNNLEKITVNFAGTNMQSHEVASILECVCICHSKLKAPTEMPHIQEFFFQLLKISLGKIDFDLCFRCTQKKVKKLEISFQHSKPPLWRKHDLSSLSLEVQFLWPSQSLTIKNCKHNSASAKVLMAGLQHCPDMQKIDLTNNEMAADTIEILGQYSRLKNLKISYQIGDHGVKILSSMLQHYSSLLKLSLPSNGITDSDCRVLAANLHFCTNLEKLDLEYNNINYAGASAIMSSLKCCQHFQELNLLQNPCHTKHTEQVTFVVLFSSPPI